MLRAALPSNREARRVLVGGLFQAIGRGLTLPFLFIYLTQVRSLDGGTVGLLVGWMGAIAFVLAPIGGALIDRYGARRVVLPLLLVEAGGTASLAVVDSVGEVLAALTVIAVAGAALWSGQTTILASLVPDEERQRVFGLSFTLLNLGIGVGGLVAGSFVTASAPATFQVLYLVDGVSYLIPALILLSLPTVGRRLADAAAKDAGAKDDGAKDDGAKDDGANRARGGYAAVLRDRAFLSFFLFGLVLTTAGYAQMEVGFTAFASEVADVSPKVVGFAFATNTMVIVSAQLFVLRWLEGRSRTRALAVVGVLFATSWLALGGAGVAGGAGSRALAIAGVVACAAVFALGETLLSPVMPAITNALATDELRGRYNAAASMVWGVSGIVGPVAAGPLIGGGHSGVWLGLVVGGSLVASILALRLHRRLTPAQDGRAVAAHADTAVAPVPSQSAGPSAEASAQRGASDLLPTP